MWLAAPLTLAAALALPAVGESLWIDELHTAWCVAGSASDALDRISEGNQTPPYFLALFALAKTLGLNHWVLRGPSIAFWLATIALLAFTLVRCRIASARSSDAAIILLWVILDRIQLFYATEARPYAAVQFLTLAGWVCVWLCVTETQASSRNLWRWLWVLPACLAMNLQPTAAMAVAWQFIAGIVFGFRQSSSGTENPASRSLSAAHLIQSLRTWFLAVAVLAIATSPVAFMMLPVWNRREQWASFGSSPTWDAAIHLFPLIPILGTVSLLALVHRLLQTKWLRSLLRVKTRMLGNDIIRKRLPTPSRERPSYLPIVFWSHAAFGPWITAWILSALEIAPIYHRRYLISCSIPLVILSACVLMTIRFQSVRVCIGIVVLVALVAEQGTLPHVWARGHWIGTLRGEHWLAASRFIGQRITDEEVVWCSSQLIEGDAQPWPPADQLADYLSLPLASIYRIQPTTSNDLVTVIPLLNSSRQWSTAFIERSDRTADKGWIIFRGTSEDLKNRLVRVQNMCESQGFVLQTSELTSFGRVSVARITSR